MVYSPTFRICMVNVGEYTIHGSYGFKETLNGSRFFFWREMEIHFYLEYSTSCCWKSPGASSTCHHPGSTGPTVKTGLGSKNTCPLKIAVFWKMMMFLFQRWDMLFFGESNISQKFDTRVFVMPKNAKCSIIYIYICIYIYIYNWNYGSRAAVWVIQVVFSMFLLLDHVLCTSKCCVSYGFYNFHHQLVFILNVAYPIGSVFCLRSSSWYFFIR